MNPGLLLRADTVERGVLVRVMERAGKYRYQLDQRLARMVVSELSEALKKGRR